MNNLMLVPVWATDLFPDNPVNWRRYSHPDVGDYIYDNLVTKLRVICSARMEGDNRRWLHVSASRPSRPPDWEDMCEVKRVFIGDLKAIQVHPAVAEYVNINPNVLHLWACLDDDGLPDFRTPDGQI